MRGARCRLRNLAVSPCRRCSKRSACPGYLQRKCDPVREWRPCAPEPNSSSHGLQALSQNCALILMRPSRQHGEERHFMSNALK